MDAPGVDKTAVLEQLQAVLSPGILEVETMTEEVALQNEAVLDDYLAQGELPDATIRRMIQRRQVFPVYFGAALKLDGVDDF